MTLYRKTGEESQLCHRYGVTEAVFKTKKRVYQGVQLDVK